MMAEPEKEDDVCDGNLLTAFSRRGEEDAFRLLVGRHIDLVYSAARAVVRDRQLAEDVTQEVFLVLVRKAESLNDRRDLAGWLYHAAVLEARAVLRKRGGEARRIEELAKI